MLSPKKEKLYQIRENFSKIHVHWKFGKLPSFLTSKGLSTIEGLKIFKRRGKLRSGNMDHKNSSSGTEKWKFIEFEVYRLSAINIAKIFQF